MKKLLNLLAVTSLTASITSSVIACDPVPFPGLKPDDQDYETGNGWKGTDDDINQYFENRVNSVKNQDWQKVLGNDFSSNSSLKRSSSNFNLRSSSDISTLAKKDILKVKDELQFTPYADMGIVEDTAEYLMKEKGKSAGTRGAAEASLQNNIVYNDLGEIAGDTTVITDSSEITLGFMQNASDTGELVPMWNAAPATDKLTGKMGNGVIEEDIQKETEYAKWFNDRYRNWTGQDQQTKWAGNQKSGNLNSEQLRISFGPFANSLWHTAWENNKTPEELAEVLSKIATKYGTKKFDFYFAAPYLSKEGKYADSQRLLASALKILVETDNEYDVQLSLVMSTESGVSIAEGFLTGNTAGTLSLLGDEAFPLYNFTKYLGMNFRLNLVSGYLTVPNNVTDKDNWELEMMKTGVENTHNNWVKMHNMLNGTTVVENDTQSWRKIKVTPWIGRRAEQAAYNFTPTDAVELRKWAIDKKLGGVGMFYISRDVPSEFVDNGQTGPAQADRNALNQNIRSGSGFKQFTYAKALNGSEVNIVEEQTTKEGITSIGGIDYKDSIQNNTALDNLEQNWEGPTTGGEGQGAGGAGEESGNTPTPPTGPGKSLYTSWAEANPNRKENIVDKVDSNGWTYFSPYIDAGLYSGNDMKAITQNVKGFDHLTLAFVQQVNQHGDYLDLSIAGQEKNTEGYTWWEDSQLWDKMLKPLADQNNFENIKVAYGGATTGGFTEKNPWTLANTLNPGNSTKAQEDLEKALVDYQQSLVDLATRKGVQNVKMPKAIDFDIEGHAQELDADNRLLAKTIAGMKAKDRTWDFSITLPVLPSGLTHVGYNVMNIFIEEFRNAGLSQNDLPVINLMLMDYGDPIYVAARDNEKITNFELARRAINATKNNLATSIEENYGAVVLGNEGLYSLIGATPMIGVNDTVHGVFTLEDAKELYNWSQLVNLGYIGIWSMNDDRGRDINSNKPVNKSLVTHGLAYLEEYDFSRALNGDWTDKVKRPNSQWKS